MGMAVSKRCMMQMQQFKAVFIIEWADFQKQLIKCCKFTKLIRFRLPKPN